MKEMKLLLAPLSDLPSPSSINFFWNYGSLMGFLLAAQFFSGIILSMNFIQSETEAFSSLMHIMRDTNSGWVTRLVHSNTATLLFIGVMVHMARGMFYGSVSSKVNVWLSGMTIYLILMATAFFGYVLPWGQMSYWGATVITNIVSAIPYIGKIVVEWLWGNFSVSQPTLNRFFSIHFVLPFLMVFVILIHIIFLHKTGSSNPTGVLESVDKLEFHSEFTNKDIMYIILVMVASFLLISNTPNVFMDVENMNESNPMKAPVHIQPEWYFLFAYAILRSIPSKLGGVIALVASVVLLYFLPLKMKKTVSTKFSPSSHSKLMVFSLSFLFLTVTGSKPVESPYDTFGKFVAIIYFLFFVY